MRAFDAWIASWMAEGDAGWVFVDPAWLTFTGQSQEAALGFGWLEAIHPDDRAATAHEWRRAWATRAPFTLRLRLRRSDGAYRPALAVGTPRVETDGRCLGLIGSVREIDAAPDVSADSDAFCRTLLGAIADGVFIARDDRFIFANPRLPAILGYAPGEFEGLPFESVVAPEDLALWTTRFEARVAKGPEPPQHYPLQFIRKNGQRLDVELSTQRIRYEGRDAVLGVIRDVTEKRKADAALRESEERFKQVVESLPQMVWTCAPDGACDYLGPQWVAYTGIPEDAQLGDGWLQRLHPNDRRGAIEQWRAANARGEDFVLDFRIRRHDGVYRWFHTLAVPLKDDRGRIKKWFGTNTDITEIKDVEDALRESEARFASFMRHLPGLAWIKDAEGRYIYVNEAAEAAFQRPLEEIYSKTDHEIFDSATAEAFRYNDLRALASDTGVVAIETLAHGDGVLHHSLVSKFPMKDGSGAVRGTGGVAIDITERRQIEQSLEQQSRLIDLSFDPIFVWDWDGGIVTWNRGCEQLYGYSRAEALGQSSHKLLQTRFPVSLEHYEAQISLSGEWAGELRHIAKNGHEICVESRQQLIRTGERRLVLEANRDVSERKRAETALLDASRRKDEFLATLAHELRNPLAPISYGVQLLKTTADGNLRLLGMMERQVGQLVKLVDDLLEISRIDRGKIELRREPTDLAAIVRMALETSQLQIEKGRHRLVMRLGGEPLPIDGDPMRLSQAVTNLINNAAKFTQDGGLIEIEAQRRGQEGVLRVRDNGRGIPPDALPHVFDLFTQIDHNNRGAGGLGIGLALVRRLIELHGGTVEASSPGPGAGSEFVVTLPLAPREAAIAGRGPEKTAAQPNLHGLRVVVIDDERDVADSLRLMLESFGAAVRVAYDGAAGARLVETFLPQVALVDLGMQPVDGFETARRIRAGAAGGDVRLVALTGWGQASDRERTKEAGFDAHLTKPASVEALENALRVMKPAAII
ncbi:PAS domain S-box protein [Methylocystis sp. IM3]|uniref:PAS domain S-box protein n=1 Tax=unclassified Methylocystis TaxID=2625913 RepID=UPI0030FB2B53